MRCPECKSLNEANATACGNCGLLLFKALPKRRADDLAGQKRRTADQDSATCQFCSNAISARAIRCSHCGEIVNEDYYRDRAARTRARVNYASWVAYIFGLGALLVFRPVGLLSISAGLILSILYYAIPAEPPPSKAKKETSGLLQRIRRQLRLERVAIPIPSLNNKKLVFVGTPLVAALIGYSANLLLVQEPMNEVLKQNAAFAGMDVSAHYQYFIVPGVIVYDLREISVKQTPIDVQTAFLEFAKKVKDKRFSRVELSYKGTTKFSIDGGSFNKLGVEYAKRNFDYVLYSFPKLFKSSDSNAPVTSPSDRDALVDFHRRWYGQDQLTKTVRNGL
jgi:hypothetical protein